MASDAARKDARERSLGGAALRLLALLALAAVVIRTRVVLAAARVGNAVGARAERVRALEHELLELAARQRAVDAELAAAAAAAAAAPAAGKSPKLAAKLRKQLGREPTRAELKAAKAQKKAAKAAARRSPRIAAAAAAEPPPLQLQGDAGKKRKKSKS